MTPADTPERGLERLVPMSLAGHSCDPSEQVGRTELALSEGVEWSGGNPRRYGREFCIDRFKLVFFLRATQPIAAEPLALDDDGLARRKARARSEDQIRQELEVDLAQSRESIVEPDWTCRCAALGSRRLGRRAYLSRAENEASMYTAIDVT